MSTMNEKNLPMSKRSLEIWIVTIAPAFLMLAFPRMADAYVGPGAGLTAIGAVLSLIGAVCLSLVGFVWYPIRRLMRKRAGAQAKPARTSAASDSNVAGSN
jgi:hypothetical protein